MGISANIHTTFQLLSGWLALSHWLRARTEGAIVAGVDFVLAIFVSVMLQETGHVRAARKSGNETRDNTLLRIGGAARLERVPKEPEQELRVALAIPAVNVVIAAALLVWLQAKNGLEPLPNLGVAPGSFLEWLLVTTVMLTLFNLILAFAMDGRRVLRAMLASRMKSTRAVQIMEMTGQGMAFLLALQGLFLNPFLLFTALCEWIGATRQASVMQMTSFLTVVPLRRATMTDFRTRNPYDRLSRAVELILAGAHQDFPVVKDGQMSGVLTKGAVLDALVQHSEERPVSKVRQPDIQIADSSDILATAFERLDEYECHSLSVKRNGRPAGVLSAENVREFLMMQVALGGRRMERAAIV